jgi:N-acetylglucosaminyl-diphospho-decaprenol L-rhamnosyltransferase
VTETAGRVCVCVVGYWSASTIEGCLRSVLRDPAVSRLVVIDNASGDDTAAIVRNIAGDDARLTLIVNPENRGFGAACNQAARLDGSAYLLFLNPDAFAEPGAIAKLARHLDSAPDVGLLGCRVVDASGAPCGPQLRREPTWRRSLMSSTRLSRLERWSPMFEGVEAPLPSATHAQESAPAQPGRRSPASAGHGAADVARAESLIAADAVNGAAMMVRREAFEQVGGFDERFVLHAEDLDLCRRIRDAGWRVAVAADVVVQHIGGVSSRRRPLWVEWQKTRSLWRYFRTHEAHANPAVRGFVAAGLAARLAARLPVLAWRRVRR